MISFWSCVQHLANSVSQIFFPYLQYFHFLLISPPRQLLPVVEILQLVHDLVHVPVIIMSCQVVNSAAKGLTSIKEGIKPICVASSRGGTHQNLYKSNAQIVQADVNHFVPCQDILSGAQSRRRPPPPGRCQTGQSD